MGLLSRTETTWIIIFIYLLSYLHYLLFCCVFRKILKHPAPLRLAKCAWTPDSCSQCSLCAFCLGSTKGICEKCSYCKDGAEGCKRTCKKGKETDECKKCKANCS